ncbi:MAG: alginate export family protein [Woeseiaceae bacterium]
MRRNRVWTLTSAALLLSGPMAVAMADDAGDLGTALTTGKVGVQVRARYEHVEQDNFAEKADALSARLRLNYATGQWNGWSAFAEFDHVFHILDDFNSGAGTSPGKGQYPVVADPQGSDLNQLYLDYTVADDWKTRLGRQRILLDNQRFVGGVGWRQNEQTYDSLTINSDAIGNTTLHYSYVANVRRIFGETVAAGSDKSNHHLLNAKINLNESWSLVPYLYYLDYNAASRAAASSATFGARFAGKFDAGDGKLAVVLEFATQSDAGDNPNNYDADYLHADAMWALRDDLSIGLGYENLGSDNGLQSFSTPLATLHKFQGWADQFVATPAAGIEDVYATIKFTAGNWNLTGVYHDFSADTGGAAFGKELDVSAATSLGSNYGLLFKGAFFSADAPAYTDTNKFWIMLTASY